jgi:hypothetical protein
MKFPNHKASLHLTHNEHLGYYRTVADAIEGGDFGYKDEDWISEEQKQKAIETNECWILQWYPHTPVGFNLMSAADLDLLLKAARDD